MAKKLQVFGNRGKSAYQYALDGGYTGSEAEFKEKMARELEVSYDYEDLNSKILATAIKQDASGTVISVSDAAAVPLLSLDYEGENVTFTVSGKNVYSGENVSGTKHVKVNDIELIPAGTYMFSASVTSSDTDSSTNMVMFYNAESTPVISLQIERGVRKSTSVTFTQPIAWFRCYAANSDANSEGDTFSFTDIQIEPGEVATDYEPYKGKTITVASPDKLNLNDFVMNKPNTIITNDKNVPMTIQYVADAEIYIDNLATSLTNAVVSLGGEV